MKALLLIMFWTPANVAQPFVHEMSSYQACSYAAQAINARFQTINADPRNRAECVKL